VYNLHTILHKLEKEKVKNDKFKANYAYQTWALFKMTIKVNKKINIHEIITKKSCIVFIILGIFIQKDLKNILI